MQLLDGQSLKGVAWTGAEKVLISGVGFVQGVILARLLSPHDFGLTAMLGIFLAVGGVLAESGFGAALVADGGKFACHERRAFRWNLGIAVVMYAALFLAAPLIASWYGMPILSPITRVMALGLVINAASVVATARLTREMRFKELAWVNSLPSVTGAAVAIVFAWKGFGVWSIVALGIASAVVRTAYAWWMASRPTVAHVQLNESRSSVSLRSAGSFRSFLSLGAKLSVSSLIHTVYLNLYELLLGRMFSPTVVGMFSRGNRWARLPVEFLNDSISRVAMPEMATGKVSGRRYLLLNTALLWPIVVMLWIFSPVLVELMLGRVWLDCVPCLRVLLVGVLFTSVTNVSLQYIRSKGAADSILVTDVVKKPLQLACLGVGGWLAARKGNADGVLFLCWAKVASDIIEASVDFLMAWRVRVKIERVPGQMVRIVLDAGAVTGWLRGKTVAVVGNGPCEAGLGLGAEIDAHEVVVRINNYVTDGFERDYGSRTDLWVKGGFYDVRHEIRSRELRGVFYSDDLAEQGIRGCNAYYVRKEMELGLLVECMNARRKTELAKEMGCGPSSGATVIDFLRAIPGTVVDVYGFSFLTNERPETFVHYGEKTDEDFAKYVMSEAGHDVKKESEYLAGLFDGRRLVKFRR